MKAGEDPRTDKHPNDGTPGKSIPQAPSGSENVRPAPGGAGTGTSNDPTKK